MKILNLYAGIGGNRKDWGNEYQITAVEINPQIAEVYQRLFPNDKIIVADAHQYLLEHYKEFDFIWSSPPCPTHSKLKVTHIKGSGLKPVYPDMKLYEEIIFLKTFFDGMFCIENVCSYYEPLIKPQKIGRHYYWCNFKIDETIKVNSDKIADRKTGFGTAGKLAERYGYDLSILDGITGIDKRQILQNTVNSKIGLHILNNGLKTKQQMVSDFFPTERIIAVLSK